MIKRILFATDFSNDTEAAEAHTFELAKALGASVDILHAIEPISTEDDDHSFDEFYFQLEKKAEAAIGRIAERFRAADIQCTTRVAIEARWRAILSRAEAERADLIIMGSHSFRSGEHRTPGTTSHRVFLGTRTPLLVVRTGDLAPG